MLIKLWAYKTTYKHWKEDAEEFLNFNKIDENAKSTWNRNKTDDDFEIPEKIDRLLDRVSFDLGEYRYDKARNRIVIYTDFEYRLYISAGREEFIQFVNDVEMALAHNSAYNCKMIAYYMDPDLSTFSSLNPFMHLIFRAFFH